MPQKEQRLSLTYPKEQLVKDAVVKVQNLVIQLKHVLIAREEGRFIVPRVFSRWQCPVPSVAAREWLLLTLVKNVQADELSRFTRRLRLEFRLVLITEAG